MRESLSDVEHDMRFNVYDKTYIESMPGHLLLVL